MTSIAGEPAARWPGSPDQPGQAAPGTTLGSGRPRIPPGVPVLARPRVDSLLTDAARRKVTLISGPAGSGKTIACASWAASPPTAERIAWVTLDADGGHWFWADVCARLRHAQVAPHVLHLLEDASPASFPLRLVSAALQFREPVALIVDNVHELANGTVLDGLAFVLRHAPPGLRLVLSGRSLPAGLQLPRMGVSELARIGGGELACTAEEADALLASLGIELSAARRDVLLGQTDGLIGTLPLAAARLGAPASPAPAARPAEGRGRPARLTGVPARRRAARVT